jgi:hypothetical protein
MGLENFSKAFNIYAAKEYHFYIIEFVCSFKFQKDHSNKRPVYFQRNKNETIHKERQHPAKRPFHFPELNIHYIFLL